MKYLLLAICMLLPLSATAHDSYSLEECVQLMEQGKGDSALSSLNKLYNEYAESSDWNEDEFGLTFMLLCNIYTYQGKLRDVADLCSATMKVFNARSKDYNTELSRTLWRMSGSIQMELKDYNSAIHTLQQAQAMYEEKSIYDNGYFAIIMFIGACYLQKADLAMAKTYLDEAEEIHKKYLGEFSKSENIDSFQLLNFIGTLYQNLGDWDESEKYFKTVIQACDGNPVLQPMCEIAKNNLAVLYIEGGKYDNGYDLLNSIRASTPELKYMNARNIAFTAYLNNNHDMAIQYLQQSNLAAFDYLKSIILNFSELEREEYWSELSHQILTYNNLLAIQTNRNDALCIGFEMNSFFRDFDLSFQLLIKKEYIKEGNTERKNIWNRYQECRGILAYGVNNKEKRDSMTYEVAKIEREILSEINLDLHDFFMQNYRIENLRQTIPTDAVVMDFIYSTINKDSITKEPISAFSAYSLVKNSNIPQLTPICKQQDILTLISNPNNDAEFINRIYNEKNDSLYDLIIRPIIPIINGKNKIYIRPIGMLSSINIGAIKMPDGRRFGDAFDIRIVSNFHDLNIDKPEYSDVALFGNPDYFSHGNLSISDFSADLPMGKEYEYILRNVRGNWESLPGSQEEVDHIAKLVEANKCNAMKFVDKAATETTVKSLSGHSPSILHFATHAYFATSKKEVQENNFFQQISGYSWNNILLQYTGLLLAGANEVWNGKKFADPLDDGILTAEEISRLDFSNTNLVVLSACDTGRGYESGVDGAMGLQRAFKAAGVKSLVTSLWQIPDEPTSKLMQYFYGYLFENHSIHKSLKLAQKRLINDGYKDPYYWAAFIAID